MRANVYAMLRYKFESNSQQTGLKASQAINVYAMLRYKFESNSQPTPADAMDVLQCVCYA